MELTCEAAFIRGAVAGVAGTLAFLACALLYLGWLGGRVEAQIHDEFEQRIHDELGQ